MKDDGSFRRPQIIPLANTEVIRLRAEDVKAAAQNRNGLTFKGFGVLSGNGTSSLLMDYKAEHPSVYWDLMKALFGGNRPMMNTVKVEMGNDRNNSTGANPAVMRTRNEYPVVAREPGFQLAADARRFNPDLRLSLLRWMAPTWVHNNDDVYHWFKNTILAVYRRYGIMVDSVNPGVNERTPDLDWVAQFAQKIRFDESGFEGASEEDANAGWISSRERELFRQIKIVTSDEESTGTFGKALLDDRIYLDAVDVASYHYSAKDDEYGSFTRLADVFDKEIWNSEAQAVFSNSADRPNNTNGNGLDLIEPNIVSHIDSSGNRLDGTENESVNESDDEIIKDQVGLSHAGATTSSGIGGPGGPLELANTIIKGFVLSRRTHAIYQPAIGACHEHMEYAAKELVSARDPWSGWVYYDAGCAVLEHFAKFAKLGWEPPSGNPASNGIWRAIPSASKCEVRGDNPVNGARHGEPSYLTLASPEGDDFTVVVVNDSSLMPKYRIEVDSSLPAFGKKLAVWQTVASHLGERADAQWRRQIDTITPIDGGVEIMLQPWSMLSITTLRDVAQYDLPLPREGSRTVLDERPSNGVLYSDDFEYRDSQSVDIAVDGEIVKEQYLFSRGGDAGASPKYTTDSNGAFEIVPDDERGHVLRQQIDWEHAGGAWIDGDPRTTLGDMRWANYCVSVDICFERYDGKVPYALLGGRDMGGDRHTEDICGYDVKIWADGVWLLRRFGVEVRRGHLEDLRRAAEKSHKQAFIPGWGHWFTLSLDLSGSDIRLFVNGALVTQWHDERPQSAGRVDLGSSFHSVRFSRLEVRRIAGLSPYYGALVDDMHMHRWDDKDIPILEYTGAWSHCNGQDMFTYMRTLSQTSEIGATLSHTFYGTGLDVLGPSDGSVLLDVYVDGRQTEYARATWPNEGSLRTQFRVSGLKQGKHTVTLRLANMAEWSVDAIGALV